MLPRPHPHTLACSNAHMPTRLRKEDVYEHKGRIGGAGCAEEREHDAPNPQRARKRAGRALRRGRVGARDRGAAFRSTPYGRKTAQTAECRNESSFAHAANSPRIDDELPCRLLPNIHWHMSSRKCALQRNNASHAKAP